MAVKAVGWWNPSFPGQQEGFDIHVLANNTPSRRLDDLLRIQYDLGTGVAEKSAKDARDVDGLKIVFVPEILFAGTTTPDVVTHTATGVLINQKTGVVTHPTQNPPGAFLRNFIIRALIKDQNGVAFPVEPMIRVHLHNGIRDAWLAPSTLTVRRDEHATNNLLPRPRFRVLAEFEDKVVGDVTSTPGMTWTSDDDTKVTVFGTGGLWAKAENVSVKIRLTLPAALANKVATPGTVATLPPWSTPTPVAIIGAKADAAKRADRINLLFISEGFPETEKKPFEDYATKLAEALLSRPGTVPFSLLKDSINIWRVFVPSRQVGTTTLLEVTPVPRSPKTTWPAIPKFGTYPPSTGTVGVDQFLRVVGLPIAADVDTMPLDDRIAFWEDLYGGAFGNFRGGRIPASWYQAWLAFRGRKLLDDRDTAFGVEIGERPNAFGTRGETSITLSDLRVQRAHLDDFLKALTFDGSTIGGMWGDATGTDRSNVVFLCRGAGRAGSFNLAARMLAIGLVDSTDVFATPRSGTPAVDLDPFPLPASPSVGTQAVLMHEWCHGLRAPGTQNRALGDEYGTRSELTLPASSESQVLEYPNIQARATLLTGGKLDGGKIRWGAWHRISKSAILLTRPTKVGSQFRLTLFRPNPQPFKKDDRIRLRSRPLVTAPAPSPEFKVDVVESATSILVSAVAASVDLTTYADTALVYSALRDAPAPGGRELTLVARLIQQHITTSRLPLNAVNSAHACSYTGGSTMVANNIPTTGIPKSLRFSRYIIGLYDGGFDYSCGVFHPTGACLMRTETENVKKGGKDVESVTPLCQVCRYILVDNIDPTLHPLIDKRYDGAWLEP